MAPDDSLEGLEVLSELKRLVQELSAQYHAPAPSVLIECLSGSPEAVDVFVGRWDGTQYTETFLKTVDPGQKFTRKLIPISWSSGAKSGDTLLVRAKKNIALYSLKNLEPYSAYGLTVAPAVYPWWSPHVQFVRWGPNQPYLIQPSVTIFSDLSATWQWQDAFYYFQWV